MQKKILKLVQELGPISTGEIVFMLRISRSAVAEHLRNLKRNLDIHIGKYEHQPEGTRGRCIPQWVAGSGPDAHEKGRSDKVRARASRSRNSAALSVRKYPEYNKAKGVWRGLL